EELAEMARDQGAVLRGLDDGVLGFDSDGRLTLSNSNAEELLGLPSAGDDRSASSIDVPEQITAMVDEAPAEGALRRRITIGERILLATVVRVQRDGVPVGGVVTLRDETQMLTMARQLESVTAMARALRTQRHEFANRLHTVLGLVETGATDEAHTYLASLLGTGPITTPVENIELLSDVYLRAVLEAKGTTAAEAGVSLAVTPDSLTMGTVRDPESVTLILGNLIDNAVVTAPGGGIAGDREGRCYGEGFSAAAAASAQDYGVGLTTGTGTGDGHGLGIGLALSRRVAESEGGRVWLIEGHDPDFGGSSFGMRLPEALDETPPHGDTPAHGDMPVHGDSPAHGDMPPHSDSQQSEER